MAASHANTPRRHTHAHRMSRAWRLERAPLQRQRRRLLERLLHQRLLLRLVRHLRPCSHLREARDEEREMRRGGEGGEGGEAAKWLRAVRSKRFAQTSSERAPRAPHHRYGKPCAPMRFDSTRGRQLPVVNDDLSARVGGARGDGATRATTAQSHSLLAPEEMAAKLQSTPARAPPLALPRP